MLYRESNSAVLLLDESPLTPADVDAFPTYSEDAHEPMAYWPGGLSFLLGQGGQPNLSQLQAKYPLILALASLASLPNTVPGLAQRSLLLVPARVDVIGTVLGRTRIDLFPTPPDLIVYYPAGETPEVQPNRLSLALGCNLLGTLQVPGDPQGLCLGAQACAAALRGPTASERQRDLKERLTTLLHGDRTAVRQFAGAQVSEETETEQQAQQQFQQVIDVRRRLLQQKEMLAKLDADAQQQLDHMQQYLDALRLHKPAPLPAEEFTRHAHALPELQRQLTDERTAYLGMRNRYLELRQHLFERLALPEE